jgi:hypothetical protein
MADITIVNGVYKPTYNWGAPSNIQPVFFTKPQIAEKFRWNPGTHSLKLEIRLGPFFRLGTVPRKITRLKNSRFTTCGTSFNT